MKFERKKFSIEVGGRPLTLEFSPLAGKANAAVLGKYGETIVLVSVVMSPTESSANYMPLKVDYEERFYAAGKIIGSRFIRREGRPSEDAILTGRLVDRVIRPLFDQRLRHEVQVVVTVLSYDEENDPDFVGLIAASAALSISDVPWQGPIAAVRIAKIGETFRVNPTNAELQSPELLFETFVAGSKGAINMIELAGKEAGESEVLKAFEWAEQEFARLVDFQSEIVKEIGKPKADIKMAEAESALKNAVKKFLADRLEDAIYDAPKDGRNTKLAALKEELYAHLKETFVASESGGAPDFKAVEFLIEDMVDALVHKNILEDGRRPDGRKFAQHAGVEQSIKVWVVKK
mgnify:FL=1